MESAAFVGAPGDAYPYLTRDAVFDEDDAWTTREDAVAGYSDDLDRFRYNGTGPVFQGLSFGIEGWIGGSKQEQSPFGWPGSYALVAAYSYPAFFYDDAFCSAHCDAASSIRLTFSYSLGVSAEASIDGPPGRSTAEVTSRASIAFGVMPGLDGFPDGSRGVLFRDRVESRRPHQAGSLRGCSSPPPDKPAASSS